MTDAALILAHEVSHVELVDKYPGIDIPEQEPIIYGAQYSYMISMMCGGVEFSREYREHVSWMKGAYDPHGVYDIPLPGLMEKWLPRIRFAFA